MFSVGCKTKSESGDWIEIHRSLPASAEAGLNSGRLKFTSFCHCSHLVTSKYIPCTSYSGKYWGYRCELDKNFYFQSVYVQVEGKGQK